MIAICIIVVDEWIELYKVSRVSVLKNILALTMIPMALDTLPEMVLMLFLSMSACY